MGSKRDKKRYLKIKAEGSSCTVEPSELDSMTEDLEGFEVEEVWMTVAEYEALPEFAGW